MSSIDMDTAQIIEETLREERKQTKQADVEAVAVRKHRDKGRFDG